MPDSHEQPVVLLYVHPLLGQGLASHLRLTTGVEVLAVPADDPVAVDAALALQPLVVIFERCPELDPATLASRLCDATFVDVSGAVAPAGAVVPLQGGAPEPEALVRIVDHAYAAAS